MISQPRIKNHWLKVSRTYLSLYTELQKLLNKHQTRPSDVGESCIAGADCGATWVWPNPYWLSWFFKTHSLRSDALLSLDIVGKTLVLPKRTVLDFVDTPWETLPSLRRGLGVGWWEGGVSRRRGKSGNWAWSISEKNSLFKNLFIYLIIYFQEPNFVPLKKQYMPLTTESILI